MEQANFSQNNVLNGIANFSVELLKQNMSARKNIIISPLSLLAVLAMAMRGAKGNTVEELEKALGMKVDELSSCLASVFSREADIPLKAANSVWVKEDAKVDFNQSFFDECAGLDFAEVFKVQFEAETCQRINQWVSEHTDNEIPKIIDSFTKEDILYLINALLFDAKWANRYDADDIIDHGFKNACGAPVITKFMSGEEKKFLRDTHATGFIKGYQDRRYEFVALLPDEGMELSEYVSELTGERLLSVIEDYKSHPVKTLMPKFEAEYSADFKPVLQNMGIKDAFNKYTADFTGIGKAIEPEHNICIGDVKQISKIKVDENGTKAVAVTFMCMKCMVASMPPRPYKVYLDRPFLYVIFDKENRMPVFMGVLQDVPKA